LRPEHLSELSSKFTAVLCATVKGTSSWPSSREPWEG
jgi:hypothetical protein